MINQIKKSDRPVVFCDSRAALVYVLAQGQLVSPLVKTSSADLFDNPLEGTTVQLLEENWESERIICIASATGPLLKELRTALSSSQYDYCKDLVARDSFILGARLHRALLLREEDYTEPRIVIRLDYGKEEVTSLRNPPWAELLGSNPRLEIIDVPRKILPDTVLHKAGVPTRADLFKHHSWIFTEYVFWRKLWSKIPHHLSRGTIMLGVANPLARETAVQFCRRGYAIREIERSCLADDTPATLPSELWRIIAPPIQNYLLKWLVKDAAMVVLANFKKRLSASLREFESSLLQNDKIFASGRNIKALFSNLVTHTADTVLPHLCRQYNIPLVMFQHGHSRELSSILEYNKSLSEETFADLFICFDQKARHFSQKNPYRIAKDVKAAGLPTEYFNQGTVPEQNIGNRDILYASTHLPTCFRSTIIAMTWSQYKKEKQEQTVINEVLAHLPHKVFYKGYPTVDVPDWRPSLVAAQKAENIELYQGHLDLRYMMNLFKIIVTSRATSTLGWCLLSGKPLVYLHLPGLYALRPDTEKAMRESTFFFDISKPGVLEELRVFLSRPLDEIEADWQRLAPARKKMIDMFFSEGGEGASRRACQAVTEFMKQYPKRT